MIDPETGGLVMIDGTDKNKDYLVVAVRGDVLLAMKPVFVRKATLDKVYVGAKFRSTWTKYLPDFWQKQPKPAVLDLTTAKLKPKTAWGAVDWDKTESDYCSAQFGSYVKGSLEDPAQLAKTLKEVVPVNLAQYVAQFAGGDHMVTAQKEITDWVAAIMGVVADKILGHHAAKKVEQEQAESTLGVFGLSSIQMKKMHDTLVKQEQAVPDFTMDPYIDLSKKD